MSCIIPTVAHTLMVMLMSSVTLAMVKSGYNFQQSALVMELHFLAMFGPGFFTGMGIQRFGTLVVSIVRSIFCLGMPCHVSGRKHVQLCLWHDPMRHRLEPQLQCWNSHANEQLSAEEATYVQAFNDFVLFSTAGAMSLVSAISSPSTAGRCTCM